MINSSIVTKELKTFLGSLFKNIPPLKNEDDSLTKKL